MRLDLRYLLISLCATAGCTFLAIAYPKMSRYITIPLALIFLILTVYLGWPEVLLLNNIDAQSRLACLIILAGVALWILTPRFLQRKNNNSKNTRIPKVSSTEAVANLTQLGWTVKPKTDGIQFEITSGPLPPMEESAIYFQQLGKPFNLLFQQVNSLEGLHYLAKVPGCIKIEISAGEFTDISELSEYTQLTNLALSQIPLNGTGLVDLSPLSTLTNLKRLILGSVKTKSIDALAPLTNLRELNIWDTLVSDLSPLSNLTFLESLEIRNTRVTDLQPLIHAQHLSELSISGIQVPGLIKLSHLQSLKKLTIMDQGYVDLSNISSLENLETLYIWNHSPLIDIAPIQNLTNLHNLSISGIAFGTLTNVSNIQVLSNLRELRVLSLGSLQISDLSFIVTLTHLNVCSLSNIPISVITSLQGLTSLTKLSLIDTSVSDISPLLALPELTQLTTGRTPARSDVISELKRRGVEVTSW